MAHRLDILSETEDNITGTGGRGAERSTNGPFLAIRNYLETQDEIKALRRGDMNIIKIIENEVVSWNEETLNLNLSTSENNVPEKRMIEFKETNLQDNLRPEHFIHSMNLNKVANKWTAIVNVSSRDDIQGGELMFRNWKPAKRFDNYGKAVGDDSGQPQWINELGTLIIFPSIEAWGYKLVVSGGAKRVIYNFRGGTYK